jgi:hypothetical protein
MIKFFRGIRKKLISENMVNKYLLYAIGEIVLVVLGILIALQINNWNNERIAHNQMISFLIELKNDLQRDTTNFSRSISIYQQIIKSKEYLKLSNFESVPTDSLFQLIIPVTAPSLPVQTTFRKITYSGLTQISTNDSLSMKVYEYYTTITDDFNTIIDFENSSSYKDIDYWFGEQNHFEFDIEGIPNFQSSEENRSNLLKLISEPKGRNYLKLEYDRKMRMIKTYEDMKANAVNLIFEIENELVKR